MRHQLSRLFALVLFAAATSVAVHAEHRRAWEPAPSGLRMSTFGAGLERGAAAMPFPANNPGTATVIASLPYTITDTFGGIAFGETWFKYTALAVDLMIGVHVATNTGGDDPFVEPFATIALTPTTPDFGDKITPIEVPLTDGVDYYFRLTGESGSASVTLAIESQPNQTINTGDILVPEGTANVAFPAVVLSFDEQAVTRALDIPNAGAGAIDSLPSGVICLGALTLGGSGEDTLYFYQALPDNLSLITTANNPISATDYLWVSSDQETGFYVARNIFGSSPLTVRKFSAAGVLDAQSWTLPGDKLTGFAVTIGGGTAYYTNAGLGTDNAIKAYDLVNSAVLPDFTAAQVGWTATTPLVLQDGSVLAVYINGAFVEKIIRFNSSGVEQATFTPAAGQKALAMARGVDETTILARSENNALTTTTFYRLLTSDLSVVDSFTVDNFDEGEGRNSTSQFFGPSENLGLLSWVPASPEPAPLIPRTLPVRWLRRTPHLSASGNRVFFKRLQIDMETGQGNPDNSMPVVWLRTSSDGGFSWGSIRQGSVGRRGQFSWRVNWVQLGSSRDAVFEISGAGRGASGCIVQAWLEAEEGRH